ncbi:uncharacterized protein LOC143816904 [Ranitomeya variabilis]|uniref:uncharacterized protein LOC143816904 n=1 Tax=Ranitomeya variabilis TaxID=490064 RepID=UPI004056310F
MVVTDLLLILADPVLISNMTSNSSRPGEDITVSIQFSGEEATLTWEVDGGPLPDRYQLIDDNRTVIIPKDEAGRRLHVRITNPVSEETREYQLENTADFPVVTVVPVVVGVVVLVLLLSLIIFAVIFWYLRKKKRTASRTEDLEMNGHGNYFPAPSPSPSLGADPAEPET